MIITGSYNFLAAGKIVVGNNKAWIGPNGVELTKDTIYSHPTNKQCNYEPDLSDYATKEDLASVSNVVDGVALEKAVTNYHSSDRSWYSSAGIPFLFSYDGVNNYLYNIITNKTYSWSYSATGGSGWGTYGSAYCACRSLTDTNIWYFFHIDDENMSFVTVNMSSNTGTLRKVTLTNYGTYFDADYNRGIVLACDGSTLWWSSKTRQMGTVSAFTIPSSSTWNYNNATKLGTLDSSYTCYWGTANFSSTFLWVYCTNGNYGYIMELRGGNRTYNRLSAKTEIYFNNDATQEAYTVASSNTALRIYRFYALNASSTNTSTRVSLTGGVYPNYNTSAAPEVLSISEYKNSTLRFLIKYTGKSSGSEIVRYYENTTLLGAWLASDTTLLSSKFQAFYIITDTNNKGIVPCNSNNTRYPEIPYQYKTESSLPLIQD